MISTQTVPKPRRVRRIRWQRFGLVLVLCAVLIACLFVVLSQLRPARAAGPLVEITVATGDTLWGLAQRYADPGRDLRASVAEIIRINQLATAELQPGQVLLLPGR